VYILYTHVSNKSGSSFPVHQTKCCSLVFEDSEFDQPRDVALGYPHACCILMSQSRSASPADWLDLSRNGCSDESTHSLCNLWNCNFFV